MYLQMERVTKIIKQNTIIHNVSLSLETGKIYGLQGKNGSGKTMILKAMCGMIRPTLGKVVVDGEELGVKIDFPRSVGVLIENPGFINGFSAFENLRLLARIQNKITEQQIRDTLEEVGLADNKKKYRNFSLGMKQKLGIAAAIMEEPKLILLDEPTNALDEKSVGMLRDILRKRRQEGALIVIASHDSMELELLADEIIKVENGELRLNQYIEKEFCGV